MRFFHGSVKVFPLGFKLVAQKDGYAQCPDNQEFESLVEARRPADKLSRLGCVYLCDDMDLIDSAGGYIDCVYAVCVQGEAQRSDLAWYSEAWSLFSDGSDEDRQAMNEMIDSYWSGKAFPNQDRSCPEYRAVSATVTAYAEVNMDLDEFKKALNPHLERMLQELKLP